MAWILDTPRLRLRELTHGDQDEITALGRTRGEASAWIGRNLALYEAYGFGFWAIETLAGSRFAGYCGVRPASVGGAPEWEMGWHVVEPLRNLGIATEAARGVRDYAFTDLGLTRLVALVEPANTASRHVAENIGMLAGPSAEVDGWQVVIYEQSLDLAAGANFAGASLCGGYGTKKGGT